MGEVIYDRKNLELYAQLQIIHEAVKDIELYDVRSRSVDDALDWLSDNYGFFVNSNEISNLREGIHEWSPQWAYKSYNVIMRKLERQLNGGQRDSLRLSVT